MSKRYIEIETCSDCPHMDHRTLTPYCDLSFDNLRKDRKIPSNCELDEVPKPFMPNKKFVLFVDNMDGDVIQGFEELGEAVKHALKNGAKRLDIKLWKK